MKYIKGFDGLRAISIILVLITHLGIQNLCLGHPFLWDNYNLFSGKTGVMIFFSISGFLITLLLLREKFLNGKIDFKRFFIRRFLRLAPPLLVFYILLISLMYFNFISPNYQAILFSFFYIYNFVPLAYYTGELGHTWSLGVEEQFYFIWPFIIAFFFKLKNILLVSLGIISVCLAWQLFYPILIISDGNFHYLSEHYLMDRWFIPACLPIMVGSLTAVILVIYENKLELLFSKNYYIVIIALSLFVSQLFMSKLFEPLIFIFQPAGVSLFLLWVYFNQNNFLVSILEFRPMAFIGKISYGVYVFQGLFLKTGPSGEIAIQKPPLNICLVFVTAILSYFFLEKRIIRYKERFKVAPLEQPVILEPVLSNINNKDI